MQMLLRGTQINYMPGKSHVIIIIINTQGQIVQIYFKIYVQAVLCRCRAKRSVLERAVCPVAACSDNNGYLNSSRSE